jgi:hypothetical protein
VAAVKFQAPVESTEVEIVDTTPRELQAGDSWCWYTPNGWFFGTYDQLCNYRMTTNSDVTWDIVNHETRRKIA